MTKVMKVLLRVDSDFNYEALSVVDPETDREEMYSDSGEIVKDFEALIEWSYEAGVFLTVNSTISRIIIKNM